MTQETTQKIYLLAVVAVAPFGHQDVYWWIGTAIVVMAAYSLRIMGDIRNKEFTWLSAFIQLVTTVCVCIFGYFLWKDAKAVRNFFLFFGSFQIFMFLLAFFSFFLVTTGDKIGKYGITNAFNKIVESWLASIVAKKQTVNKNEDQIK